MRLILMSLLLSIPCIVGYEILMAKRAIGKVVFGGLLGGLCNIVLSVFLVKQCNMGLLGIAVGSVTTMFITQSVLIPMMVRSHVKLSLKEFFWLGCAKAVVGAVPMVVVGILMVLYWPAQSLVMILFQMALCGLVYAAGVWTLSLDTRDRRKVSSAARQVIAKLQRLSSGGRS